MSRRHHGGRPHRLNAPSRPFDSSRPAAQPGRPDGPPVAEPVADLHPDARTTIVEAALEERLRAQASPSTSTAIDPPQTGLPDPTLAGPNVDAPAAQTDREPRGPVTDPGPPPPFQNHPGDGSPANDAIPHDQVQPAGGLRPSNGQPFGVGGACTAPQLRRFIKSRPYVPMHELRRRFGIDGGEDDVTPVQLSSGRIYVGLPSREGSLLGELLRGGEIGYELSLDPRSPVVVGLYPMRPVARN
jgi:hypothetical protein